MSKKLLFIDACVRPDGVSRTRVMARELVEKLMAQENFEKEEIRIEEENILPLNWQRLCERDTLVKAKKYDHEIFRYARQFASADEIVIAAPFWDMSFPAVLKIYFENVSVSGLTFIYNENNEAVGLCKARKIWYVTTAGGQMYYNGGFEYVKGLCSNLFGIKNFEEIKKEGLDAV